MAGRPCCLDQVMGSFTYNTHTHTHTLDQTSASSVLDARVLCLLPEVQAQATPARPHDQVQTSDMNEHISVQTTST